MKKLFILMPFLAFCKLYSQTQVIDSPLKHQIGVNANLFIKQFLNFNGANPTANNPYLLQYKYLFNPKLALRTGIGFNSTKSEEKDVNLKIERTNSLFDYRIGLEIRKHIHKKWLMFGGLDLTYNNNGNRNKSTSVFDDGFNPPSTVITEVKNNTNLYGLGAVYGIEFSLNAHIKLLTETTVNVEMGKRSSSSSTSGSSFPVTPINRTTKLTNVNFTLPSFLVFVMSF